MKILLSSLILSLAPCAALAQPAASAATTVPVLGTYQTELTSTKKARGISGMGCLGRSGDASRECLVINDEETFGEVATLTKEGLKPTGQRVIFTQVSGPTADVRGKQRKADCGSEGEFGELDGEGVAVTKDFVYLIGSHSCSGGGKYTASSYLLVRFKPSGPNTFAGTTQPDVERTWRAADMLVLSAGVGSAFGKPKGQGTNIEGVAVIGETLYAGLRAPVTNGTAYIANAGVADLFAAGHEQLTTVGKTIELSLGAGIRDLAALDNEGLLILSGPSDEEKVEYKIWYLPKPLDKSVPIPLTSVSTTAKPRKAGEEPKAESITVIDQTADRVTVIVNYDNIDEGAPASYQLQLHP